MRCPVPRQHLQIARPQQLAIADLHRVGEGGGERAQEGVEALGEGVGVGQIARRQGRELEDERPDVIVEPARERQEDVLLADVGIEERGVGRAGLVRRRRQRVPGLDHAGEPGRAAARRSGGARPPSAGRSGSDRRRRCGRAGSARRARGRDRRAPRGPFPSDRRGRPSPGRSRSRGRGGRAAAGARRGGDPRRGAEEEEGRTRRGRGQSASSRRERHCGRSAESFTSARSCSPRLVAETSRSPGLSGRG